MGLARQPRDRPHHPLAVLGRRARRPGCSCGEVATDWATAQDLPRALHKGPRRPKYINEAYISKAWENNSLHGNPKSSSHRCLDPSGTYTTSGAI